MAIGITASSAGQGKGEVSTMSELVSYLERSALFGGLERATLEQIAGRFEVVSFKAGEVICSEGDDGECMYVIGKGDAKVVKRMGRGERELMTLPSGEHFGEMALISNAHRSATVRALTDVECARMDQAGFDACMNDCADFAQRILRVLTARLKHSDETATRDMLRAHHALSFSLAKLADSRDPDTGAHLYRVRAYCVLLAELLADHPEYRDRITESFVESLYLVAPLHDIGKVAIADGILLKEGKLTDIEFEAMSTHTLRGAEALDTVLEHCDLEMFRMARRVILYHHERWDGKGYPNGVEGEDVPLEARIMTLADIYDALLSKRVYKPAFTYEEARNLIAESSGERFDPVMTQVFLDHIDEFEEVHREFSAETPRL